MAQSKENTNNSARSKAAAQSTGAPAAQTGEKRPRTTRRPYYNRRPRRPQQPREAAGGGVGGYNMDGGWCGGAFRPSARQVRPHSDSLLRPCRVRKHWYFLLTVPF